MRPIACMLLLFVGVLNAGAQPDIGAAEPVSGEDAVGRLVHDLLLAREDLRDDLRNIKTLNEALSFHHERQETARRRLVFSRVQVDVQTHQAGTILQETAGGEAGKDAMKRLRETEQRTLALHLVKNAAERQVQIARESARQVEQRVVAHRQRIESIEEKLRAEGGAEALQNLPDLPEGDQRHVDICPFCRRSVDNAAE